MKTSIDDLEVNVRKLSVADGDTLVLTCPRKVTEQQRIALDKVWLDVRRRLGMEKVMILVLDDGCDLSVLRREAEKAPAL